MRTLSLTPVLLLAAMSAVACASTNANNRPATPATRSTPLVRGDEFRVVASSSSRDGDAYDAALLFDRANAAVRAQRCGEAITDYERLVQEFPDNRRVWVSQYNRGLCLQRMSRLPEAADAMRAAARDPVDNELTRDASFRLAVLGEQAQEPRWVVEATDALLARPRLEVTDRVEALARRAAALLAQGDRDAAQRVAEEAAQVAPTPEAVSALGDDTYAAQARVVLAEVTRLRAADVIYRVEETNAEESITRRVQLVTHAHVQFNEAIRVGNPHWAAAAGFRIGEMYRDLYHSIVDAPLPADWDAPARERYRQRTGERLRPLLQGALRSWEATLSMARRNGISDNEWVRRADAAINDLRALILGAPQNSAPTTPPRPAPASPVPSTVRPAA